MGTSMASRLRATVLVALALASPIHQAGAQSGGVNAAPVLKDFRGLGELRPLFESDRDKIRIVLLLSPT
jgi:hypothetical protein